MEKYSGDAKQQKRLVTLIYTNFIIHFKAQFYFPSLPPPDVSKEKWIFKKESAFYVVCARECVYMSQRRYKVTPKLYRSGVNRPPDSCRPELAPSSLPSRLLQRVTTFHSRSPSSSSSPPPPPLRTLDCCFPSFRFSFARKR